MTETNVDKTVFTVKIDSLAYGPYGIGRREGQVILTPLTAPGDEVEVRVVEQKPNYAVAEFQRVLQPSPVRRSPPCPYFAECGGCPWQHIRYESQLISKERNVVDALKRIGKLDGYELIPILPSPEEYRYRRRVRLHVHEGEKLGFHRALSHDLIEIDSCPIAEPHVEHNIINAREWLGRLKTAIREIEIVGSDEEEKVILAGKADGALAPDDDGVCSRFLDSHNEVMGLILFGRGWRRSWGQATISTHLENGLKLEIDGEVFTQVNRQGNDRLVGELLQWGEFYDRDRVLELYCGAGNFTFSVAQRSKEVIAIDNVPRAIENGKANSRLNRLKNIRWLRSHVPHAVKSMQTNSEKFSKIILNPPRSGAKGLEKDLASLEAQKILYVSCNPPTLARDLAALSKKGYRLSRVRPFDLFPQTFHVETLAEMVR
jgi:23S rRNA (uracil1939-C5)-methyltransferase